MGFPAVTFTFSNSTTADATQVNQNFTDIINGLSDTTKNISVSAGTFAGTLTASGNVTLGGSSSNTITFTGSMASSLVIGTTYSYDIGGSTIGLRSVYLGSSDSAARTTRVIGATVASSWTMTLPIAVPAQAAYVLESTTGGVTSWTSRTNWQLATKTAATYTITAADDTIIADATSNAITLTLPSPSATGISGKTFRLKRLDATYTVANLVTIARAAAEKIDGVAASIYLATQGECYVIQSNGTDWIVLDHIRDTAWTSFTPTGAWTTNTTYTGYWRRVGDTMEINYKLAFAGAPTNAALTVNLPTGYTIDTTKIVGTAGAAGGICGSALLVDNGNDSYNAATSYNPSNTGLLDVYYWNTSQKFQNLSNTVPFTWGNTDFITLKAAVPIANWS